MLTPEQIDAINTRTLGHQHFARAIEAEVRKQDEALILELVEALTRSQKYSDADFDALAAGAARLKKEAP